MPIIKAAKKSVKSSERKRVFNDRRRRIMRASIKELKTLVDGQNKADAVKKLPEVYKAIDKATKRGVITKNTASRKKSKLSLLVNKA